MAIDTQRLSPAPWKTNMLTIHPAARIKDGPTEQLEVVDGDFDPRSDTFSNFLKIIARCDCTKGKYEVEEANAEFIAIARNAFDVMMRRGWSLERFSLFGGGFAWRIPAAQANDMIRQHGANAAEFGGFAAMAKWPDPFTALVEADRWYRENVEGRP